MKDETMLIQGVPKEVKSSFKAACARRNKTMKSVILKLMQDFVKRQDNRSVS